MRGILLGVILLAAGTAFAQGLGLTPAVPDGSALIVTPQAGPWMICAASYSGQSARGQAEELAGEIRGRYNLPAYVFNRTAEERRQEQERVARIKEEMRKRIIQDGLPADTPVYVKTVRIEDQYAVVVGGYKDDVTARKELDRIRTLRPSQKYLQSAYVPDDKGKMHEQAINPFQTAFVCRNPSIPVEKPKQEADLGPKLKEYNAHESYSLLKCPKRYTLVVKVYKGAATVQGRHESTSTMEKMNLFRKTGELLDGNAKAAHMTAEYLRTTPRAKDGQVGISFEAYALHTEFSDYVTIGGFDSPDDPRMAQTAKLFMHELNRQGSAVNQLHVYTYFMTEPMPMAVPQVK
jgi:hypothetical protein